MGIFWKYVVAKMSVAAKMSAKVNGSKSPKNKSPVCTMPKSANNKNNKSISDFHPGSSAASTQWDIEVISKPG